MATKDPLSRRRFLKVAIATGGGSILAACGASTPGAETQKPVTSTTATTKTATATTTTAKTTTATTTAKTVTTGTTTPSELPFKVAPEAMDPFKLATDVEVDGVFFAGGYGEEYTKYAADLMEQLHPGLQVKVSSVQKIAEELRPRFVGGNPPDVIANSGAGMIPNIDLINEDQLLDLTPLLDAPALDTPGKKFRDTLFPGSQVDGLIKGKQYWVNIGYTISGVWYSKPAFETAGYTYPKTWDEMLTLCEQIKSDGKASPWTYQGKFPYYIWEIMWKMLVYYAGGDATLIKLDNLEPNAWFDDGVKRATEDLYKLWDKGYIMPGTAGLSHTEAQTEWLKGKAIFIPCGNWLENEMKKLTSSGFDMVVNRIPGYADGKGDINAVNAAGGENFIVPSKAKNPQHGMEYLRCLLSKNSAAFFAENVKAIMPVIDGTEGAKLSPGMVSALELADSSKGINPKMFFTTWYSALQKELETRIAELMTGKIKPDEFLGFMQKTADAVAQDPDVEKITREQ